MTDSPITPSRRSRRIAEKDDNAPPPVDHYEPAEPAPVEILILNKRRRTGNRGRDLDLEAQFAELEKEPRYDDIDFDKRKEETLTEQEPNLDYLDDQVLLENDFSDSEKEETSLEDTAEQARQVLEEDLSDRVIKVISDTTNDASKNAQYRFFKRKCTLPDSLLIEDGLAGADLDKENFIYDRSSTFEGRKFLLCSGAISHWFRRNWQCPHSIYQWLFQIVAFESDKFVSKLAYTTLESLWSNVGAEPAPYRQPREGKRDLNRYIDIASFRHILTSYGAVRSELEDSETENAVTQMSEDWSDNNAGQQRIPLEQFSSALRLFSYSVRTWPQAYRQQDIKYIVRLLLQIRLDRVGNFLARDVENAIESTLSALNNDTWKSEIRSFALELVHKFPYSYLQSQITKAMKPTYERSAYLKRMFALASLNMFLYNEQSKVENEQKTTEAEDCANSKQDNDSESSTYITPSSSPSDVPADESNDKPVDDVEMKLFRQHSFLSDALSLDEEYKSATGHLDTSSSSTINDISPNNALQTPVPEPIPTFSQVPSDQDILSQVLEVLKNKYSIFKSRKPELDYEDVLNQAILLAEATGANEAELIKDKMVVLNIIMELQQIGRRIGVGLGSYARTKASEAVQRLWTRLAYMKGRDETMNHEEHVA